ncbi:MAG TPA: 3-phosphoserine/phosphohydroxythreonine transaminase [Aromatoleum sp.]|uniref:3-phosphoserine/phosphohydroxythreonine transaminase n=1 Tax=Aromatoleum sp. TaxID=2307007 RepID=UPI002B4A47C1|nr:3-phosphoserine/phosphohydroxythreonine transaminase [Aromatoleum sp.]HJV27035.1 3-phosphoserine/phosphohydroxythreonine transaminase [Aromatoleum sp.]
MASRSSAEAATLRSEPGFSFSAAAGPLPPEVIADVAEACGAGASSILSLPFTTPAFRRLQEETEACLRRLLAIPDRFRVLFLAGGASAQFAGVPMNLLGTKERASYVESGCWSRRAIAEARRYADVSIVACASGHISDVTDWQVDRHAAYCHLTSNETADGLQFHDFPALDVPLVADMTSDFLTRPLDFTRLSLVYAGTQKTIGTPGLTIVIVDEGLLQRAHAKTPRVMDYTQQAEAESRLCTPPVFPIFVAHRMLHWIEARGGVPAMACAAKRRSDALYAALEEGEETFTTPVERAHRSLINPCFRLADEAQTALFLHAAEAVGLRDLRGHPEVGGLRVSLYNGIADIAVDALVGFLRAFARRRSRGKGV